MKPESAAFLKKSRGLLDQADTMLRVDLNEAAGRTAYLAGLPAAQAFIFETTGHLYKRHSTVHGEFGRLVKDNPRFDNELRAFLPQTYKLKAIADYGAGPDAHVPSETALEAVTTARRFVECVAGLIDFP